MNIGLNFISWSIPILVFVLSRWNYYSEYLLSYFQNNIEEQLFDFIVVGAGSSGSVLANRLSKNSRVLLLEAGGPPLWPIMSIPGLAWSLLNYAEHDYMYKTIPQRNACLSSKESKCSIPRGKVLGGSSVLNLMQYVRSNPLDYNNWANITEDSSWNYDNLLPYFKKSINYAGEFKNNQRAYGNSTYGFINVEGRSWTQMNEYFMEAGAEFGFAANVDFNGPQVAGFGPAEFTTKNGLREDTFSTFIQPFLWKRRGKLQLMSYSTVTKIHLDYNKRVTGVSFNRFGKLQFAKVSKEVILSAGTIDTPKLLMLSGIGPKSHLQNVGIKPILDLPVGQHLKDHFGVPIGPFIINQTMSYIPERNFTLGSILNYIFYGKGPLETSACTSGQAFINSSDQVSKDWPDLQLYFLTVGSSKALTASMTSSYAIKYEVLEEFFSPTYGKDGFMILLALVRVKSSGSITLANTIQNIKAGGNNLDGNNVINIDPEFLSHPDDKKAVLNGIKFILKLVHESKSFKRLNATLSSTQFPPCTIYKFLSDKYWDCYIQHFSTAFFHPVGTNRMGGNPGTSVVDTKLNVIGTNGLRIVDASIMPEIVNGNTNAACIMIAEKAADLIREFWSKQSEVCKLIEYYLLFEGFISNNYACYYSKLV